MVVCSIRFGSAQDRRRPHHHDQPPGDGLAGDPVFGRCMLPKGLLYVFPSELSLSAVKPQEATSRVVTLANRGATQLEWFMRAPRGQMASLPSQWRPLTDNTTALRINPCSYQEAHLTVPSTGLPARRNYSMEFTVVSNSISGDITTRVSLSISALLNASQSQLTTVPSRPTAGGALEVRILAFDSEGQPIYHARGGDEVTVSVYRDDFTPRADASCTNPQLAQTLEGQQEYYTSNCRLPTDAAGSLLTGRFRVEAAIGPSPVGRGSLTVTSICPANLLAGDQGTCICGLGTFLGQGGRCQPCPPGSFKGSLQSDACELCGEALFGSSTRPGVEGAASRDECVCVPGRFLDANG
jgi:hypothetical protein